MEALRPHWQGALEKGSGVQGRTPDHVASFLGDGLDAAEIFIDLPKPAVDTPNMSIKAIWSGGQTGADQGGLEGAEMAGVNTGGWMPKGFLTETGPRPDLAAHFGLQEHKSAKYPQRTLANVIDTDATVIVGSVKTGGSLLTLEYCRGSKRPFFIYRSTAMHGGPAAQREFEELAGWLIENDISRLNVAGNRESKSPGIQAFTRTLIHSVIEFVEQR